MEKAGTRLKHLNMHNNAILNKMPAHQLQPLRLRHHGSLAGGFLVAVVDCALFAVVCVLLI